MTVAHQTIVKSSKNQTRLRKCSAQNNMPAAGCEIAAVIHNLIVHNKLSDDNDQLSDEIFPYTTNLPTDDSLLYNFNPVIYLLN